MVRLGFFISFLMVMTSNLASADGCIRWVRQQCVAYSGPVSTYPVPTYAVTPLVNTDPGCPVGATRPMTVTFYNGVVGRQCQYCQADATGRGHWLHASDQNICGATADGVISYPVGECPYNATQSKVVTFYNGAVGPQCQICDYDASHVTHWYHANNQNVCAEREKAASNAPLATPITPTTSNVTPNLAETAPASPPSAPPSVPNTAPAETHESLVPPASHNSPVSASLAPPPIPLEGPSDEFASPSVPKAPVSEPVSASTHVPSASSVTPRGGTAASHHKPALSSLTPRTKDIAPVAPTVVENNPVAPSVAHPDFSAEISGPHPSRLVPRNPERHRSQPQSEVLASNKPASSIGNSDGHGRPVNHQMPNPFSPTPRNNRVSKKGRTPNPQTSGPQTNAGINPSASISNVNEGQAVPVAHAANRANRGQLQAQSHAGGPGQKPDGTQSLSPETNTGRPVEEGNTVLAELDRRIAKLKKQLRGAAIFDRTLVLMGGSPKNIVTFAHDPVNSHEGTRNFYFANDGSLRIIEFGTDDKGKLFVRDARLEKNHYPDPGTTKPEYYDELLANTEEKPITERGLLEITKSIPVDFSGEREKIERDERASKLLNLGSANEDKVKNVKYGLWSELNVLEEARAVLRQGRLYRGLQEAEPLEIREIPAGPVAAK